MGRASTIRFKIDTLIKLAKLCDPDDGEQRQAYMKEADSLLTTLDTANAIYVGSENKEKIRSVVEEIALKANDATYMTVSEFMKQDKRLYNFDASAVGRVLSDMGYTNIRRGSLNSSGVQPRLRLLPLIENVAG